MIKTSYEMDLKTENTELDKIKELEKRIYEQENIINKQKEKIGKLTIKNEILRHNEYIKHKNRSILEEINKVLEICINFIKKDTIYYSIYGSFFENLFSNLSLDNTKVKIFLEQFFFTIFSSISKPFDTLIVVLLCIFSKLLHISSETVVIKSAYLPTVSCSVFFILIFNLLDIPSKLGLLVQRSL